MAEKLKRPHGFSSLPYQKQKVIIAVAFLFIPLLLLIVFTYYPAVSLVRYSLLRWDGYSSDMQYIGLKNYQVIFTQASTYLKPALVSLYYLAGSVIQIGLALVVAAALNYKLFAIWRTACS